MMHMCQSIGGALKNWSQEIWELNSKNFGGPDAMKHKFQMLDKKGWKVFPCCDCDNFDVMGGGCKGDSAEKAEEYCFECGDKLIDCDKRAAERGFDECEWLASK